MNDDECVGRFNMATGGAKMPRKIAAVYSEDNTVGGTNKYMKVSLDLALV